MLIKVNFIKTQRQTIVQDALGSKVGSNDRVALLPRVAVLSSQILGQVKFKQTVVLHRVSLVVETKENTVVDRDLAIIVELRAVADGLDLAPQPMKEGSSMLAVVNELF